MLQCLYIIIMVLVNSDIPDHNNTIIMIIDDIVGDVTGGSMSLG